MGGTLFLSASIAGSNTGFSIRLSDVNKCPGNLTFAKGSNA